MAAYRDRQTGESVVARKIEDPIEIARWLVDRGLIDYPAPFEPAPTVGRKGQYVVTYPVKGVWQMEVLNASAFDERYETIETPPDEPATV